MMKRRSQSSLPGAHCPESRHPEMAERPSGASGGPTEARAITDS